MPVSEIITPTTVIKIDGKGIPESKSAQLPGDLYIKFHIIFPEFISLEDKKALGAILI